MAFLPHFAGGAGGASAMASRAQHPVLPSLDVMEPERPPPTLASELLEEIFLRVASPADLGRASAACVSFRRLIRDPSFLRRYRSVHPPQLLGFLSKGGFHPVELTHPSAAVARAADFSLDFLPSRCWDPCDVRDGRVLVKLWLEFIDSPRCLWDLAVCDPLFQRFLLLPPITDDLLASVGFHDEFKSSAALIPSGAMEEETSSSVICWMSSTTRFVVFIFSTSSRRWTAGTSFSWADLGLEEVLELGSGQCVYGCFYWKVSRKNKLLKLDMNTMGLSTYDLPPDSDERSFVIVESGEGKVAMFRALHDGKSLEYYTLLQNGTEKSRKWHLKSTIPLPFRVTNGFLITGGAEGYVFIARFKIKQDTRYLEFFSIEIKSLNIERVCRASFASHPPPYFPYFGFPPSISPRRIREYGEE